MSFDMLPGDCRGEILKWSRLLMFTSEHNSWKLTRDGESWWRYYRGEDGKWQGTHFVTVTDWEKEMMELYYWAGIWEFHQCKICNCLACTCCGCNWELCKMCNP